MNEFQRDALEYGLNTVTILGEPDDEFINMLVSIDGFVLNEVFPETKIIINCGLKGKQLKIWNNKNRLKIKNIKFINNLILLSKYNLIKLVESIGIPVPETHKNMNSIEKTDYKNFVTKHEWDSKGIRKMRATSKLKEGEYVQKFLKGEISDIKVVGSLSNITNNTIFIKQNKEFKLCNIDNELSTLCKIYTANIILNMNLFFCVANFIYNHDCHKLQFINLHTNSIVSPIIKETIQNIFKHIKF